MRKRTIWGLVAALTIVSSSAGTKMYLDAKQEDNMQCVIHASRESYTLDESIEEADAVAEIQIDGIVKEVDSDGFPQTVHKAKVLNVYKGNLEEEIEVLQDGTVKMPISDNPIFEKGEKYILAMKKATANPECKGTYWILKEYFVAGNQAIETLPTGALTGEEEDIKTYESKRSWNRAMMEKEAELPYDSEIMNKSELVEVIEGEE